jgi:rhodanese-related sulfurtransferase
MSQEKCLMDFVMDAKTRIKEVEVAEAQKLIEDGYRVLDVREPAEYLSGAINHSLHVPRGMLEAAADRKYDGAIPELRDHRDAKWLVMCRSGARAAMACDVLQQMGYSDVTNVFGGMVAWKEANLPLVAPSDEESLVQLKTPCTPGV